MGRYDELIKGWDKNYKNKPLYKEIQRILHPKESNLDKILDKAFPIIYKKLPKDFYNSEEWAQIRIKILRRDDFKCIHCSNPANHIDHINSAYYFPKIALDPNNLISSCENCHKKRQPKGKWK